ncbi:MAG: hypothetical protein HFJ20_00665 [Clostridia bacterium]|nr:hypothetical protein [Clostridia bacterium]
MTILIIIIYTLFLIIFALIGYAIMQIKLAGMNVKDFWSFIEANKTLDKLYKLSKQYEQMNAGQQIIFLAQAENVFNAFDKIPNAIWEEEYSKYRQVLETYRNIRVLRWAEQ